MKNVTQKANDASLVAINHTPIITSYPNDVIKVLHFMYLESLAGRRVTHMQINLKFCINSSTAYVSDLRVDYQLFINDKQCKNEYTGRPYCQYWLNTENITKAEKILRAYSTL
jgi:hypothetical protein